MWNFPSSIVTSSARIKGKNRDDLNKQGSGESIKRQIFRPDRIDLNRILGRSSSLLLLGRWLEQLVPRLLGLGVAASRIVVDNHKVEASRHP
jgi:hypothetical protein